MLAEAFLNQALVFALVLARMSGFVVVSPWPGAYVGVEQRTGLTIVLSFFAMFFGANATHPPEVHLDGFLLIQTAMEFGIGLVIGIAFRMVLAAAEIMGEVVSQSVGLGTPSLLNPALGIQDTVISQIAGTFAMLLFIGAGVHRTVLAFVLESFTGVPIGTSVHLNASAPIILDLAGQTFSMGVRLAAPVIAMAIAVQVALAFISRAAPSLQLFSIGFTVLLVVGFSVFALSLRDIAFGMIDYFGHVPQILESIFEEMLGAS